MYEVSSVLLIRMSWIIDAWILSANFESNRSKGQKRAPTVLIERAISGLVSWNPPWSAFSIGDRLHVAIERRSPSGDRDLNGNHSAPAIRKPLTSSMQIDMTLPVHARMRFPRVRGNTSSPHTTREHEDMYVYLLYPRRDCICRSAGRRYVRPVQRCTFEAPLLPARESFAQSCDGRVSLV